MSDLVYDMFGSVSLNLIGQNISNDSISNHLNLQPTSFTRKGEKKVPVSSYNASDIDVWEHTPQLEEADGCVSLKKFINKLYIKKDDVVKLSNKYRMRINFYLSNEYFMTTLLFDKTIIRKLGELNIELYISIISDGVVKDDNNDSHTLDDALNTAKKELLDTNDE